MNLIAKVMSAENIPDSDARKLFTLYPVPAGAYVEFRRAGADLPAQMYFIPDSDREPNTCVPLEGVGNVYVLQDGKTVSTFNPDPYPVNILATSNRQVQGTLVDHTGPGETLTVQSENIRIHAGGGVMLQSPSLTTGVAKSGGIPFNDPVYANSLKTLLGDLTVKQDWALILNAHVVSQVEQIPATDLRREESYGIFLPRLKPEQDDATMTRYFNRVQDAFLNSTPRYSVKVEKRDDGYALLLSSPKKAVNGPVSTTPGEYLGETVSGLLLNNVERAVSLWVDGARTVVLTRPLKISGLERDLVKSYFIEVLKVSLSFACQGDNYLSFTLTPIQ